MINIAVLGAGRIGQIHAKNIYENSKTHLKWVFDPVKDGLEQLENITEKTTQNIDDIFNDKSVDAIAVSSPTPFHTEMILRGCKTGKKVFCEKPVSLSLDDANKCLSELGENAKNVMIGFNRRFDPSFSEVKNRLSEVGNIEQVIIISRDPGAPPAEYLKNSGGLFKDMMIHDFDMARFLLGGIDKVISATGQNVVDPEIREIGDFDAAVVTLVKNNAVITIVNDRRCVLGYDQRLEVFGSKGMLRVDNIKKSLVKSSVENSVDSSNNYEDFFLERYAKAYKLELDTFVDNIENDKPMSPSLVDGVEALNLAQIASDISGIKL